MVKINLLSMFSGVGGFDLGLEAGGMTTIYQVEWDKHARTILDRHWPNVPKWGDIQTLTADEILRHGQLPDVVAWGSPCQDLSVAGKRAGLDGERSGLFHEGIRIIKELRERTNNAYPRVSIWENVAGALTSNGGKDFGIVLDEMAKAGAMVIEWALLDAQYFGVPQRRRRIFVVAIFDPAVAERSPDPLLPLGESLRRNPKTRNKTRKTTTSSTRTSSREYDSILGSDIVGTLNTSDAKHISNQYVNENKVVVEPFVKSSRPRERDGSESWIEGEVANTVNSFDVGDIRTTTAIVGSLLGRIPGTNHEGVRDGQLVLETAETLLVDGTRVGDVRVYDPPVQTLSARMGTGGNTTPIVAYGVQGNVIGRQDQNGPQGKGHTEDGEPMFTLTSTDVHAVAYDEYNGALGGETHHALRAAGTISTGVLVENDIAATLRSGGDGGVPSSRGEHLVTNSNMTVRRLTPLECERLMGWPDDHTRYRANGTEQTDGHRYRQCGNGVASPVAQWIAEQLRPILEQ